MFRLPRLETRRSLARLPLALALIPLLSSCNMVVLNPAGDVAQQQGNLVLISTAMMLLIIVPVMALTALFAWRYRAANKADVPYEPDWDHSTQLELVIWGAPLLIIICLGALTWVATHLLDPYRPLARTAPGQVVAAGVKPLEVDVVALDWKWLFIYPEYGIATVNELAAPTDRPIQFRISSSSVMNSFYIPALAGQIYAMPGMETKLHAVFNRPGTYEGFSANFSGAGFSHMRFRAHGVSAADFDAWVKQAKGAGGMLDRATYLALERPSEKEPVRRFAAIDPGLFDAVLNMCVEPGKMCMRDMMGIDRDGGMGHEGAYNIKRLSYDKFAARGLGQPVDRAVVGALCAPTSMADMRPDAAKRINLAPLTGAGLRRPNQTPAPSIVTAEATLPTARPRS